MATTYFKDIYELLSKRHPNKNVYVISDHHFFHNNIISYQRNNFTDVNEMNEYMINKHNSVIKDDDIVIFLGDFSFKKNSIKEILSKMKGIKYLLLGNHDAKDLINCYQDLGFEGVFINPVKINDYYLSHQPLNDSEIKDVNFKLLYKEFSKHDAINYHGHTHSTDLGKAPFINVCVEATDYIPFLIGKTKSIITEEDKPLLINSLEFEKIISYLKNEKNIDPNLIITDYIYSMMLEATSEYRDKCLAHSSFPLYKKYGYISNFSDLDVSILFSEDLNKAQNLANLKNIVDGVYNSLMSIDNINLSFYKRMANVCIFNAIYSNGKNLSFNGYYDANLIFANIYHDSDFIVHTDCTSLEKFFKNKNILDNFKLPRYEVNFLNTNGDIANLILQIIFQKDINDKSFNALKKLNYIYRNHGNQSLENISSLEDMMTRFFIRNILFFYTTRRYDDLKTILNKPQSIDYFMNNISSSLKKQVNEIIINPDSEFNKTIKELAPLNIKYIPEKSKELLKVRKKLQ